MWAAALCLLLACSRNVGTVTLTILTSPNLEEDPLPTDRELTIELRVEGPGTGVQQRSARFEPGETHIALPEVTVGKDRIFSITVREASGAVFARGRSLPLEITGDEIVQVYVSRVNHASQGFSHQVEHPGLRVPRFRPATLPLQDGQVLIAGGAQTLVEGSLLEGADPANFAEIFDPTTGQRITDLLDCGNIALCLGTARSAAAAGLDVDGSPLLAGGQGVNGPTQDVERFAAGRFETATQLPRPRSEAAAFPTPRGLVIAGGLELRGGELAPTESALVRSGRGGAGAAGALQQARWAAAAASLPGGGGVVMGGFVDEPRDTEGCDEQPTQEQADQFCFDHYLGFPRCDLEAGRCLGDPEGNVSGAIDVLGRDGVFQPSSSELIHPRAYATATTLPDGRVVIAGGLIDLIPCPPEDAECLADDPVQNAPTFDVEVYDPVLDVICPAGTLRFARWLHAAIALAASPDDGRIVLFGGYGNTQGTTVDTIEIIDIGPFSASCEGALARGTNMPGLHLRVPRAGHTATLMANGAILIAGGTSGDDEATDALDIIWIE